MNRRELPHLAKEHLFKKKCIDNIILDGEKLKTSPLRSETKQGCHFLHHFFSPILCWKS